MTYKVNQVGLFCCSDRPLTGTPEEPLESTSDRVSHLSKTLGTLFVLPATGLSKPLAPQPKPCRKRIDKQVRGPAVAVD